MPDFYHTHARAYFEKTKALDPSLILGPFIRHLSPGSRILDVGCGSGRDLLWLKKKGFNPSGFERSPGLAALARNHSGCPVKEGDFRFYDFSAMEAKGILLSGAFVHLASQDLVPAFDNVLKALIKGGHVLLSLKQGRGTISSEDGRIFTLWQDGQLRPLFDRLGLQVEGFLVNESALGSSEVWLGYVLKDRG